MSEPLRVVIADTSALIAFFNQARTVDVIVVARGRVAAGRWEVPGIGPLLLASHEVLADYPAIGLADAMNVVLAREFRTDVIATLDRRHFPMLRPLTKHDAFRLLPDDIPEKWSRHTLASRKLISGE